MSNLLAEIFSRSAAGIFGLIIFAATTISLLRTVVVPRALRSYIADTVALGVVWTTRTMSRLRRTYLGRDATLTWTGPMIILCQLLTWLILYLFAYGFMIYGISGQSLGDSIRQAGSSLFTLGFASSDTESQTIVDFVAAATGPIVIALLIGFLPTIYGAYLDRESEVTMLSAVAGEPAWGPELLSRFTISGGLEGFPALMLEWARWSTRMRLTHVTYPVLLRVRSVRGSRHYVLSLLAVMDAAALYLALTRKPPRREAFALMLQGGQTLELLYVFVSTKGGWSDRRAFSRRFTGHADQLARATRYLPKWNGRVLSVQVASDIDILRDLDQKAVEQLEAGEGRPISVDRSEFDHAVSILQRSNFPIENDLDAAWEEFRVARARYEWAALRLCRELDATPGPWSGSRHPETSVVWPTFAADILDHIGDDDNGRDA